MNKIKMYGEDILSKTADEVDLSDTLNLKKYIKELGKAYEAAGRTKGLAAPQAGISKRIILCRLKGKVIIMINPVIHKTFGRRNSNEGCESVTGRYIVKRPVIGKVSYYLEDGTKAAKWYLWKKLRVICHEVDHLNGICINQSGKKWKGSKFYR